ncbi:putative cadmium/zinc-transporting ATPase HMA4 [Raphanus sativus]|nr:putative cadmium/zinc-transporting ATPase HMA4 [Raphanus sativus]
MQILGQELIDLEKGLAGETCKSSCCGTKEKARETSEAAYEVDCNSGSCRKNEAVKQICHEKTCLDIETGESKLVCCGDTVGVQSDLEEKNEIQCKSGCCGDERKQTEEITLASEEETESLDFSPGCCENKEESCHEKACLGIDEAGVSCDLKLACCETTEGGGKEKLDLEKGLQINKEGQCKSDCCETGEITLASGCCGTGLKEEGSTSLVGKEREIVKLLSQSSCCTSPMLSELQVKKKIEICCKVKTPEAACGYNKCKEREKRHIGKSCCRSYAKEYCSHRHHHHHHHHHVGAV